MERQAEKFMRVKSKSFQDEARNVSRNDEEQINVRNLVLP